MSKDTKIKLQAIGIFLLFILASFAGYGIFVFVIYLINVIFSTSFNIWLGGLLLILVINAFTPLITFKIKNNKKR
jgi:hypothetical protein